MKKALYIITIVSLATLFACQRRPLTYDYRPYTNVQINVDWSESLIDENKPLGVSAWFYSKTDNNILKFKSNSVDSFFVDVPEGNYDVVVFNRSETEFSTIGFRGVEQLSTFELYSQQDDTKSWYTKTDGELIVKQPELVAVTVHRDFEVTKAMIAMGVTRNGEDAGSETLNIINVTPQLLNKDVNVKIKVIGIQNLLSARSTISGMAEGFKVDANINNTVDATYVLADWTKEGSYGEGVITFDFTTLGLVNDINNSNNLDYWKALLNLEVLLVDNKTVVKFPLPLVGSMVKSHATGEIDITISVGFAPDIDGVEPPVLPDVDPVDGEGGMFDAEINGWENEVIIPIPVG